ncbi:MAG: U32 family peptidase [Elusimicrobia bacterium]|nr:U32 family peptidase [Elusimicrobiota bacterium]
MPTSSQGGPGPHRPRSGPGAPAAVELLAPAKDLACGLAAIDCGADAVYIGAPEFGARQAAGNPVADIARLAARAHRYWARVYAAVNTILTDAELPRAGRLLWELHGAGVDGFIIQDVGLLELELPPLPLIASTQMHNDSIERVRFLEAVGFQRAILARELSLDQIRAIRRATAIELECFVHGALCVSASGRCYMSCALGGRSGNRGACAQPCRRPYSLVDGAGSVLASGRHLLSLKDLDLSAQLGPLLDAGVTSFKIEGRLKDSGYVKNIVSFYRRKLDDALGSRGLRAASSGSVGALGFEPNPAKTFNRGATTYCLSGTASDIAAPDTPKSLGEAIGPVVAADRRGFTVDGPPLAAGDGICYFDGARRLQGTSVRSSKGGRVQPESMGAIRVGTFIWRNLDRAFQNALNRSRPVRRIRVAMTLRETAGGLGVEGVDEDGVVASCDLPMEKAPARDMKQAEETARRQLVKLGESVFLCDGAACRWSKAFFVPVARLNELRRGLVERLLAAREERRPRGGGLDQRQRAADGSARPPEAELDYRANVLNAKARRFYERHGARVVEPAAESGLDMRGRVVMTTRLCLRKLYAGCLAQGGQVVAGAGRSPSAGDGPAQGAASSAAPPALFLIDEDGRRFRLEFDCAKCVMRVVAS